MLWSSNIAITIYFQAMSNQARPQSKHFPTTRWQCWDVGWKTTSHPIS